MNRQPTTQRPTTQRPTTQQQPRLPAAQLSAAQLPAAQRRSQMWMAHHWPDEYDRCVSVRGRHVCRRCLWFYPVCFATMLLSLGGLHWPAMADPWILWLTPLPVVFEWWGEHRDWIGYSARRQVVTSVLVAPAVGRGLARYLTHPGDGLFWAVVLTYAVVCLLPVVAPRQHPSGRPDRAVR